MGLIQIFLFFFCICFVNVSGWIEEEDNNGEETAVCTEQFAADLDKFEKIKKEEEERARLAKEASSRMLQEEVSMRQQEAEEKRRIAEEEARYVLHYEYEYDYYVILCFPLLLLQLFD